MKEAGLHGILAVSFDLDDTFWDCAPAIEQAELTLQSWLAEHAPLVLQRHRDGGFVAQRDRLIEHDPALAGDVSELRKRALAALFRDAAHDHALSESAFEVFYRARSDVVLYEGVRELLNDLRGYYRVAAITNGNADLGRIGIADAFELTLHATLERPAKPDPGMFRETCEAFDIEPARLLHVGDSATTDVAGARASGCRSCWFNQQGDAWQGPGPEPDHEVASIAALRQLLIGDRLLQQRFERKI